MPSRIIIASAGSGKTTRLVTEAAALKNSRILVTTYTNENCEHIRKCLIKQFGYVPSNITVTTWFNVLFNEGVRPYQNLLSNVELSRTIALVDIPQAIRYVRRDDVGRYFFTSGGDIYRDRVSDFVCLADDRTEGLVINRLGGIYSHILIDELQDLSGYDLTFLEKLFRSKVSVLAVGDPRQATYATNRSRKNKSVERAKIADWVAKMAAEGLISQEEMTDTWRSNQVICDFADALYPTLPKSSSKNSEHTKHDGVFEITPKTVEEYYSMHQPVVLRWDKRADTFGLPATNIGLAKGRTFDRVLIISTEPMKKYLKTRDLADAGDISKLYVAVTRARFSVAFVI